MYGIFFSTDIDPIVAAAHIITALQSLVSRETSPLGSAVISVTRIRAGDAYNIIPDTAEFGGTIRALTEEDMRRLETRFQEVVELQSRALRCTAEIDFMEQLQPYYPPTVNDPAQSAFVKRTAAAVFGPQVVQEAETSMGGEDYAFFARVIPAAYTFIGIRNETAGSVWPLHSPHFTLDEEVLQIGASLHVALATQWLAENQGGGVKEL